MSYRSIALPYHCLRSPSTLPALPSTASLALLPLPFTPRAPDLPCRPYPTASFHRPFPQSRRSSPALALSPHHHPLPPTSPQDANAILECQVSSRMEAGDHWLVYATVLGGKVMDDAAPTAVHHRKVGNHY